MNFPMIKNKSSRCSGFRPVLLVAITLLAMPVTALAYLDPTTGSMVISAIVGLFASLVLAIKTYWYRIKKFFKSAPTESDGDSGSGDS